MGFILLFILINLIFFFFFCFVVQVGLKLSMLFPSAGIIVVGHHT